MRKSRRDAKQEALDAANAEIARLRSEHKNAVGREAMNDMKASKELIKWFCGSVDACQLPSGACLTGSAMLPTSNPDMGNLVSTVLVVDHLKQVSAAIRKLITL